MERRAQLLGHIIVFVIGLFVISAILLFGYQVLENLDDKRCELTRVQFGTNLKSLFNNNKDWGSNDQARLTSIPCDTTMVCFFDRSMSDAVTDIDPNTNIDSYYIYPPPKGITPPAQAIAAFESSFANGVPTNVFTVQPNGYALPVEAFNTNPAPIDIDGSINHRGICLLVQAGILEMGIEGTGQEVSIYQP